MKSRSLIGLAVLTGLVLIAGVALAGPLEDGRAALEKGDFKGAIEILTKALESGGLDDSAQARAYYLRGRTYEAGQDYQEAERDYAQAVWREPSNPDYQQALRKMRRKNKQAV